jgi:hypothetical protein
MDQWLHVAIDIVILVATGPVWSLLARDYYDRTTDVRPSSDGWNASVATVQ